LPAPRQAGQLLPGTATSRRVGGVVPYYNNINFHAVLAFGAEVRNVPPLVCEILVEILERYYTLMVLLVRFFIKHTYRKNAMLCSQYLSFHENAGETKFRIIFIKFSHAGNQKYCVQIINSTIIIERKF
jgi:hypothetical protein